MSEDLARKAADLYLIPDAQIDETNVHLDLETNTMSFKDAAALKLVLDDTNTADNYININQWASGWTMSDTLYQSPAAATAFDGSNVAQANVPKFLLSNHISSIVPKLMGGIFYEDPPFLLRPRPGTKQEVIRAKTALMSSQLWDMKFEEEAERTLDQMALLGTGIMKWGYLEHKVKIKRYKRKAEKASIPNPLGGPPDLVDTPDSDELIIEYMDKLISRPWITVTSERFWSIRVVVSAISNAPAGWFIAITRLMRI